MSNYDRFDADRDLQDQLEEARSAGQWIPWACSALALSWWGGAAAYVFGKVGMAPVMAMPPAELGGAAALAIAPGFALIVAGVMGRESVRSSHANAIVLKASTALMSPSRHSAEEVSRLADLIRKASEDISEQLSDAEARVQVLRQDLDDGANSAIKAAEVVRADSEALRGRLAEEREALMRLSDDMRQQMTSLTDALPRHVENLTRAAEQAQSDVRKAGREMDDRLNAVEETGKSLASRVAQLDQMTADTRKRAQNLVTALVSINEQLLGSSKTVDNAVRAGDLAVEASRTNAEAIRAAMDSALDGARDTVNDLGTQAERSKVEAQAAIERLELAGQRAEAAVKAATQAAEQHAQQTEARMEQMSQRMYESALKSTQAAETGLERARQRIEKASSLLNGLDDAPASAAPAPATQDSPAAPAPAPAPARIVRPDRPSATPAQPVSGLDEDILAPQPQTPGRPSGNRVTIQDLTPFDPLESEEPELPPPPPAPTPMSQADLPPLPAQPLSQSPATPSPSEKPVATASPVTADDVDAPADIGRPSNADMTWRDLLSSIDEPDGRNETALAFVDQLGRAGIRLKRAIRSNDLRRIANATSRGERHRRKATRQAAPGELQQIERLLRQDHDLRVAAESYLAIEEPDALKFLTGAERTRDDAGPRLAAFLLLDAALG